MGPGAVFLLIFLLLPLASREVRQTCLRYLETGLAVDPKAMFSELSFMVSCLVEGGAP